MLRCEPVGIFPKRVMHVQAEYEPSLVASAPLLWTVTCLIVTLSKKMTCAGAIDASNIPGPGQMFTFFPRISMGENECSV